MDPQTKTVLVLGGLGVLVLYGAISSAREKLALFRARRVFRDTRWLAPDEAIEAQWPALVADSPGLFERRLDARLVATSHNRLTLVVETKYGAERFVFASPRDVRVAVLGPSNVGVAGGRGVLVAFGLPAGPLRLIVHEHAATYLPRWIGAHASLTANGDPDDARFDVRPAAVLGAEEELIALPCTSCGSFMGMLAGAQQIVCPHCGAAETLPSDVVERDARVRSWLEGARRAVDYFTDEQATRLAVVERGGGAPLIVPALPVGLFMVTYGLVTTYGLFQKPMSFGAAVGELLAGWAFFGLLLGIVSGIAFARRRVDGAYRRDLRALLLAIPPLTQGAPARCRICGAPLDARESLVSCRYCAATNLVTSDVAQSIAASTNRHALFFDAQARDARAQERVHAALSTRATYLGYAAGALLVAPVFTLVTALAIASAHAVVVGEGTTAPDASPASSAAPAISVAATTTAAPKIPPPSTAASARARPGTTGTAKRH